MKVMHLLRSNKFSGAENVVIQIIKEFEDDKDIEMTYVSPVGLIENKLKEAGVNYLMLDKFDARNIDAAIKRLQPDIIHAHDFSASIMASKYYKDMKVISHIHNNPLWLPHINIRTVAYALSIHRYCKIIGVSDAVRDEFVFKKLMNNKFLKIPNVVNKENVLRNGRLYKEADISDVLFVGRLTPQKKPLMFLEISKNLLKNNPTLKIYMVGDGELRNECEAYIKDNNLKDNVKLLGFQDNPHKYMNATKVLVLPSAYEGFGLVAIEAMLQKRVVVCSGVGGLSDIVDNQCGFICDTIENYVAVIEKVLNDKKLREEMGDKAYQKACTFTDLENQKKKILNVYEEVEKV